MNRLTTILFFCLALGCAAPQQECNEPSDCPQGSGCQFAYCLSGSCVLKDFADAHCAPQDGHSQGDAHADASPDLADSGSQTKEDTAQDATADSPTDVAPDLGIDTAADVAPDMVPDVAQDASDGLADSEPDANTDAGPLCTAQNCQSEAPCTQAYCDANDQCVVATLSPCCGDGLVEGAELCDDGLDDEGPNDPCLNCSWQPFSVPMGVVQSGPSSLNAAVLPGGQVAILWIQNEAGAGPTLRATVLDAKLKVVAAGVHLASNAQKPSVSAFDEERFVVAYQAKVSGESDGLPRGRFLGADAVPGDLLSFSEDLSEFIGVGSLASGDGLAIWSVANPNSSLNPTVTLAQPFNDQGAFIGGSTSLPLPPEFWSFGSFFSLCKDPDGRVTGWVTALYCGGLCLRVGRQSVDSAGSFGPMEILSTEDAGHPRCLKDAQRELVVWTNGVGATTNPGKLGYRFDNGSTVTESALDIPPFNAPVVEALVGRPEQALLDVFYLLQGSGTDPDIDRTRAIWLNPASASFSHEALDGLDNMVGITGYPGIKKQTVVALPEQSHALMIWFEGDQLKARVSPWVNP